MTGALPSTTAKALDRIADEVMQKALSTPRRSYRDLAAEIDRTYGLDVSEDNLRVWLNRRFASSFRKEVEPSIRCPLDDYFDLVTELRSGRYLWTQVLQCLKGADPSLDYTPEGLRSWYCRRAKRGVSVQAQAANAGAGVAEMRHVSSRSCSAGTTAAVSEVAAVAGRLDSVGQKADLQTAGGEGSAREKARAQLEASLNSQDPMAAALAAAGLRPEAQ